MSTMRIGIDLGGTKTEGIVLSDEGEIVARRRIATPRDYDATIAAIASLVTALEADVQQRATVGVGIPGAVTRTTGLVKNANSTWLIGRPLAADLEARLDRPIRVMNDANCFAISEAADGAGAGSNVVFGVILGTGVGGGIVVRGECLVGPKTSLRVSGVTESATVDGARRVVCTGVLLREARLHRDIRLRPRIRTRSRDAHGRASHEPGDRLACGSERGRRTRIACALLRPARTWTCLGHQRARSRRHRARRRDVEHSSARRGNACASGALRLLGQCSHACDAQ